MRKNKRNKLQKPLAAARILKCASKINKLKKRLLFAKEPEKKSERLKANISEKKKIIFNTEGARDVDVRKQATGKHVKRRPSVKTNEWFTTPYPMPEPFSFIIV